MGLFFPLPLAGRVQGRGVWERIFDLCNRYSIALSFVIPDFFIRHSRPSFVIPAKAGTQM